MLKGIDPILGPELLATLRAMGHADEIAIVDANFPAAANARRLIRAEGVTRDAHGAKRSSRCCRWSSSSPSRRSAWRSTARPTSCRR